MSSELAKREAITLWVCVNCLLHLANGECGDCHRKEGHEGGEPLSRVDVRYASVGMGWQDHSEDCLTYTSEGNPPGDYECECETNTFSTMQCEGCGSYLYGERHAITEFIETGN